MLVGVFVFSVMWSELLMTSAISCPLWSSVYECHKVECAFTSPVRLSDLDFSRHHSPFMRSSASHTAGPHGRLANNGLCRLEPLLSFPGSHHQYAV